MPTGVLAIQGDFEKHIEAVHACGGTAIEVRDGRDLVQVDRLIIPGGESTTVGLLMRHVGLDVDLRRAVEGGMPVWGTCMGMILLAKEVVERPQQWTLGLLDIGVRRNAFGAQVHSFEDEVAVVGLEEPVMGVFIRAPIVERVGEGVEVLSRYGDRVVGVRQGRVLGTSYHPELTEDRRLHAWFLGW